VTGRHEYTSDMRPPGLLHGRMIRPPRYGAELTAVDSAEAQKAAGVSVVRDGNFIGVLASSTEDAAKAAFRARVREVKDSIAAMLESHELPGSGGVITAALLELAIERERRLGRTYPAACLELDLAAALEAAGRTDASNEARTRAASVLEPLGCVNPF